MKETVARWRIGATPTWYGRLLTIHALAALAFSLVPACRRPLLSPRIILDTVLLPVPEPSPGWADSPVVEDIVPLLGGPPEKYPDSYRDAPPIGHVDPGVRMSVLHGRNDRVVSVERPPVPSPPPVTSATPST